MNRKPIESIQQLRPALQAMKPAEAVVLQIERSGRMQYIAFEWAIEARASMKSFSKVLALIIAFPLPAFADSLQCGEKVVANGTTQAEVAARCGPPAGVDRQPIYSESATAIGPVGALPPAILRSATQNPVEIWTYNFGPNRLMQRVRFENGVVVRIESLGYGFQMKLLERYFRSNSSSLRTEQEPQTPVVVFR